MDTPLTKKDVEKMVQDGIKSYMDQKQFNLSKIPTHSHMGTDAPRINENDLLPADQYSLSWVSTASEVFRITKIPNFSLLTFYGIASNGAFGGGPYNEKATISGEARVGTVYSITSNSGIDYYSNKASSSTYFQACTSAYTDVTSLAKQYVSTAGTYFAYVYDGTNDVVIGRITSVTEEYIEITVTLSSSWYLQGFFFLS